jgi:hypothetical protein
VNINLVGAGAEEVPLEGKDIPSKAGFIAKAFMDGLMLAAARQAVPFKRSGFFAAS